MYDRYIHSAKLFKKFLELIQSYEDVPFSSPKWPICAEEIFQYKSLLLSSTYQPFSLCKILKKLLQGIQSYEDAPFLGPKWHIYPNENFFRKSVNKPCSFHSFLSTCQKSKSDINLVMKYCRLKNTEISLVKSHFWL